MQTITDDDDDARGGGESRVTGRRATAGRFFFFFILSFSSDSRFSIKPRRQTTTTSVRTRDRIADGVVRSLARGPVVYLRDVPDGGEDTRRVFDTTAVTRDTYTRHDNILFT